MKQVLSADDVVRMKAQTTPHNNVTLLCPWQAQACLNMLQLAHYENMDISLSNDIHVILTHRSLNFDFWPGFDECCPNVRRWGHPAFYKTRMGSFMVMVGLSVSHPTHLAPMMKKSIATPLLVLMADYRVKFILLFTKINTLQKQQVSNYYFSR